MPLIAIDGPEKVGKSTLLRKIAEACRPTHAVTWQFRYPIDPRAYRDAVKLAADPDVLVLLDRYWASEAVYPGLVGREPVEPWWWLEWCLGLPARTLGLVIVAAPAERLGELDDTDHTVSWEDERAGFTAYAERVGIPVVDPTAVDPRELVDRARETYAAGPRAPVWSGVRDPELVVLGERRNTRSRERLAWAPASTRYWRRELEARLLDEVQQVGWRVGITNAVDADDDDQVEELVLSARAVIAYGGWAVTFTQSRSGWTASRVHPAALYRWGRYK